MIPSKRDKQQPQQQKQYIKTNKTEDKKQQSSSTTMKQQERQQRLPVTKKQDHMNDNKNTAVNNNNKYNSNNNNTIRDYKQQQRQSHNDNEQDNNNANHISQTRLCVKNIPLHFNESDMKNYIYQQMNQLLEKEYNNKSQPLHITDCKILRRHTDQKSRRIAFIGFNSIYHATFCLTKLNKAYCDSSSRLIIEYAKHLSTTITKTNHNNDDNDPNDNNNDTTTTSNNEEKTKASTPANNKANNDEDKAERKKNEFLSVMGVKPSSSSSTVTTKTVDNNNTAPTSRRQFWSNDDNEDHIQNSNKSEHEKIDNIDDDDNSSSSSDSSTSSSSIVDATNITNKNHINTDENNTTNDDQNDNNNDDNELDFLRSKQVAVIDFDNNVIDQLNQKQNEKEKDIENDIDDDDNSSNSSSSYSDSSNSSSGSTSISKNDKKGNENHEVLNKKVMTDDNHKEDRDNNVPLDETDANNDNINNDDNNEDDNDNNDNSIISSNRIFIRNLPFTASDDELREHIITSCSLLNDTIEECHIPIDDQKRNKGYGFITFINNIDAINVMKQLDGTDFQGRLLHILQAKKALTSSDMNINDYNIDDNNKLSYKQKMEMKRQNNANKNMVGWSSSYIRDDAVIDNLAIRLGISKGNILSVKDKLSSGDAAVRLALAETALINENRKYFENYNINMDTLVSWNNQSESNIPIKRSKIMILVKNLPYDTNKDELIKIFNTCSNILLPPSKTIAIIQYIHSNDAKIAFKKLAYRRYKNVPLYLEWAPLLSISTTISTNKSDHQNSINDNNTTTTKATNNNNELDSKNNMNNDTFMDTTTATNNNNADEEMENEIDTGISFSIYIKNLNYITTEDDLNNLFTKYYSDVRTVRIPKKVAPINSRSNNDQQQQHQSMGFGFVEFGSLQSVRDAIKKLQGTILNGHALELKPSNNSSSSSNNNDANIKKKQQQNQETKLMIRNVPFQATKKELLQLFGSFGQLKNIRLPKKFDGNHRGFAFIEYLNSKEAYHAMKSLSKTHLYGRHLVLEYASSTTSDNAIDHNNDNEKQQPQKRSSSIPLLPQGKKTRFE